MAKTNTPVTDAPAMTRAAIGATATRTVIAAETADAATGLATAMAAAVARPTPSKPPAARPAVTGAADVAAAAVTIIETAIRAAVEVAAVMATIIGAVAAAAVVVAHARDLPVATFTGPVMTDESIVTGEIGEVARMTTAVVGEAGRPAPTDQSARRRRLL